LQSLTHVLMQQQIPALGMFVRIHMLQAPLFGLRTLRLDQQC
jgi:hypothetical protein